MLQQPLHWILLAVKVYLEYEEILEVSCKCFATKQSSLSFVAAAIAAPLILGG